jgi:hypothetical protein
MGPVELPLEEDSLRNTCSRLACEPRGGAGVYGPSPSCFEACGRTAFLTGLALGTDSSAGLGEVVLACGGLWVARLPDENLDEMLENQEPLRCVRGTAFLSSETVLVRPGREVAPLFPVVPRFPVVAAAAAMAFVVFVAVADVLLAVEATIDVPVIVAVERF